MKLTKRQLESRPCLCFYCYTRLLPRGGRAREFETGRLHTCGARIEGLLRPVKKVLDTDESSS